MIIFICITVLSCILLWIAATGKKVYSHNDMLWAMYIVNREMRVRENATN